MKGRSAIAILAVAAALVAPAAASAAGFSWTAGGIGEAFGPGHTATELGDGRLLFAGGSDTFLEPGGTIACCRPTDRGFDVGFPRSGTTVRLPHMTTQRTGHHAVLLSDGRVLAVGGDASGTTSELFVRDRGSDSWTRAGDLPAPVGVGAIAIALDNGKVLYAGGSEAPGNSAPTARAALFDPVTTTWSSTGSLTTARRDAAAAKLSNGRVLVSGGTGPGGTPLASAETFDPAAGTWSPVASMTTPRAGHALVTLDDGRVLAVGGSSGASAEVYDSATDHWTATPAPAQVAGGPVDSMALVHAVKLADGSVIAVDTVHTARFFPNTGTWRRLPDAPFGGHRYGSLTRLADGRVLYAFGFNPNGQISAGADVLGPPVQLHILSANGTRVRYRVGEPGPTRFSLARKRHRSFTRLRGRVARVTGAGTHALSLNRHWRGHRLTPGLYRLKAVASSRTDLVESRAVFAKFRIR